MSMLIFALACVPTAPTGPLGTIVPADPVASRFSIELFSWGPEASLEGSFADRVPVDFHVPGVQEGACRVMTYTPSTCDPTCTPTEACVEGSCEPFPVRTDRGEGEWEWPGGTTLVEANVAGLYLGSAFGVGPGTHGFTIDGLSAEVGTLDDVAPTEDWSDLMLDRPRSESVTLGWSNAVEGARVRLRMTDCTGSHGGLAENEIACDAPDTGELVLHGSLLDVLDDGDWTRGECGTHVLERYLRVGLGDDAVLEVRMGTRFFYRR